MTPAQQAKLYGAKSLKAVSEFSELNRDTLRRYHRIKPQKFKALCLACLCDDLGLTANQMIAAKELLGEL